MMFSKDKTRNIKRTELQNKLNIITDSVDFVESVIIGVMIGAGSQNENDKNNGVAHFLEHMAFKGTKSRTAKQISDAIENIGGYTNAYTSKERTMYYIKVLKKDAELAISILADIMQNSVFDAEELEKERGVILQEMRASFDTPSDIVFDYFAEEVFGKNTSLGRSIIGTEDTIRSMNRDDILDFVSNNYYAENMVIGCCGKIEHDHFVSLVEKYFVNIPSKKVKNDISCSYVGGGAIIKKKKDLQQMQFLLGFKGFSDVNFEDSIKAGILSNILGGGMSSRLFQEIREKRGLAYSVSSYSDSYNDTGVFCCYADSSVDKAEELLNITLSVLNSAIEKIDEDEVLRVVNQCKSSILMSQESLSIRMRKMLNNFLMYGRYIEPQEVISVAESFSANQMSEMLNSIVCNKNTKPTLLMYGDFDKDPSWVSDFNNNSFGI